jgi:hypothetical protein
MINSNESEISLLKDITAFFGFVIIALLLGFIISKGQVAAIGFYIVFPFLVTYLYFIFKKPELGLLSVLHFAFVANGLSRFIPVNLPFGLVIDGILVLTIIATIFKVNKEQAGFMHNPLFYIFLVWFIYTVFQLVNPEARSKEAWFYAVRGVSMYKIEVIALALILLRKRSDMEHFIKVWFIWSLISAFYGFKMNIFGVTSGERAWLDAGGSITHEIHGRLRIFSFYSDAGQFGAAMAHTALAALILALGPYRRKLKIYYWAVFAICFWAYALSGSRGPLFVLASGGFLYLILMRNFKAVIIGSLIGGLAFGLLKFTSIGATNYQIQRMRTALDPEDASLLVRIENQKKLKAYLATRPFGGGIGSGGSWGQRFTPGTFLAETALDSWYVKIWVETGIVGLYLHIITLVLVLVLMCVRVFNTRDDDLRQKLMALTCGYFGIALASYGNQILGQQPTGVIIYLSMVFVIISKQWDTPEPTSTPVTLHPGRVTVHVV